MSDVLLLVAALVLGSPSLHVVSSSVAADFERALLVERPSLTLESMDEADVAARLDRRSERLALRIEDLKPPRLRLERAIPIAGEPEAALRVAVLLTLSALDREETEVRSSTTSTTTTRPLDRRVVDETQISIFSFHLTAGSGLWLDQPRPQVALAAGFLARWSWLRAGVQVGVFGLFCCDRENDFIESSWTELGVGGLVGATLIDETSFRISVDLGAGLLAVIGSATPKAAVFASPGVAVSVDRLGLELLAAAELELSLSPSLAFVGRAGLRLTPLASTIELPEAFQTLGEPLDSPWGGPFIHLGLRFFFF